MSHGSYAMENGIDFRSAAQQQQAMMMGGGSHQGGAQGPGSVGNSSGIVRYVDVFFKNIYNRR